MEWPSGCTYWDSPIVQQFMESKKEPIYVAAATGCAFGLRAPKGPLAGAPMSKAWMVRITPFDPIIVA